MCASKIERGGNEIDDWVLCVKKDHVNLKKYGLHTKFHQIHLQSVHRYTLAHSEKILERSFAQKKALHICYNEINIICYQEDYAKLINISDANCYACIRNYILMAKEE